MRTEIPPIEFGFLNAPYSIDFGFGKLSLYDNFEDSLQWINTHQHEDGNLYPPLIRSMRCDINTIQPVEERPNTRRPARVFDLPASHTIAIEHALWADDVHHGDAAYVIHLCGMLFETRLQFSCWRIDSKVPMKKPSFWITEDLLTDVISKSYSHWRELEKENQKKLIHILYMHGRGAGCEWSWLKFVVQYMVFDSIYGYIKDSNNLGHVKHADRIFKVCDVLETQVDGDLARKAIELRNELIHEASIEGSTPGIKGDDIYLYASWLYRLNQRLICSICGYENEFSKSRAHIMGAQFFDRIGRG